MKKLMGLIACVMLLGLSSVFAQSKEVTGTVIDESGFGLPGVSVAIKGTSSGTSTDIDGKWSLEVTSKDVIEISFIGMVTQEIPVGDKTVINVTLKEDRVAIDEVMVVAFGTAKKTAFTGSATALGSEKLETRTVTNVAQALDGASAGVQVSSANGQPGSAPSIRIRGFGSMNASNDPLYVVDGVPYDGNIANISSDDIASMTILKDASSTALYGSRAANGVVMITTKTGKKGSSTLKAKVKYGIVTRGMDEYERVNAKQYYPLMWEGFKNALINSNSKTEAEAIAQATAEIYDKLGYNPFNVANDQIIIDGKLNPDAKVIAKGLDWYEPIERVGHRQDYGVTASGGNEKSDYYLSVGYLKDQGYVKKSDYERFSARLNVNTQAKEWVKLGANLSATITKSNVISANSDNSSGYANPFNFARNIGPIYPVYGLDAEGNYVLDAYGNKQYDFGAGEFGHTRPAGASSGRHAVAEKMWDQDKNQRNALSARGYAEFNIVEGLTFKITGSTDISNYRSSTYSNSLVGDGAPGGRGTNSSSLTMTYNMNQILRYQKQIGMHTFSALVGHESYETEYKYLYGFRAGVIVENNPELVNFTETKDLTSYTSNYRTEGYLSRVAYDYNSKYFVDASYRKDGSSKFDKDVRWGDFWSFGFAWDMSKEDFLQDLAWLNLLKVRASYGEVGNDGGIGRYASQALYESGFNNAIEPGYIKDSVGNPDLLWESSNSTGVAVEFEMFDKRLEGSIELFNKESDNLLFEVPLPLSSGMTKQTQNIGSMYNRGIEVTLSGDIVRSEDFNWSLSVNATTFKNEITKLPQESIAAGTKRYEVGHSRYDYYLRQWYGVDETDGAALYILDPEKKESASASKVRVVNGVDVTTDHNLAKYDWSGTSIPDVYGSFTNNLSYKGVKLSFMFAYRLGGDVYDNTYASLMTPKYGAAAHKDILNHWTPENTKTDVPRMDVGENAVSGAGSTRWLTDASYLSLKNISVSYDLPQSLVSKMKLSNVSLSASGENLWLLSARQGMDPQQSYSGTLSNSYVPAKVFSFGLNITF